MNTEIGRLGVWASLDGLNGDEAARFSKRIEDWGYSALWTPEAVGRDPFSLIGYLAARTESLVFATGIANIYARDATAMAAAARSLSLQSGGRFLVGIGVSHKPFVDDMRGGHYGKPLTTMARYLDGMESALWAGPASDPAPVVIGGHRPGEDAAGANSFNGDIAPVPRPWMEVPCDGHQSRGLGR